MLMQQEWTIYKTVSQNLLFLLYLKKTQKTLKKMIKKLKERKLKKIFLIVTFTQWIHGVTVYKSLSKLVALLVNSV